MKNNIDEVTKDYEEYLAAKRQGKVVEEEDSKESPKKEEQK